MFKKFMSKKRNKKRGFTLIELIIVVAIIAILAAIAVPAFGNVSKKAQINTDISNARTIYSLIMAEVAEGNEDIYKAGTSGEVDLSTLDIDVIPKPKATEGEFSATVTGGKVQVNIGSTKVYPDSSTPYSS